MSAAGGETSPSLGRRGASTAEIVVYAFGVPAGSTTVEQKAGTPFHEVTGKVTRHHQKQIRICRGGLGHDKTAKDIRRLQVSRAQSKREDVLQHIAPVFPYVAMTEAGENLLQRTAIDPGRKVSRLVKGR